MSYSVPCECGKRVPAGAGDAGATLRCTCGRAVEVPSLHQLRLSAGEEALTPVLRIRAMLAAGLLPGKTACVVCGAAQARSERVHVECERVRVVDGPSKGEIVTGCIGFVFFGWLLALAAVGSLQKHRREYGDDVSVQVPLPVCDGCRGSLGTATGLRAAVRAQPDYADLLDRYPNARVVLLGGAPG